MLTIVAATQKNEEQFWSSTWLGTCLRKLEILGYEFSYQISYSNTLGLSKIYNRALASSKTGQPMVLVHDDVSIQDLYFFEKLQLALRSYDVVGVVGSRPPHPVEAWNCPDFGTTGAIAQPTSNAPDDCLCPLMENFRNNTTGFPPQSAPCRVMDGLFLAVNPSIVNQAEVAFDEDFDFHHYDMAFCERAFQAGLRLGIWPIWAVHQSPGGYDSPEWKASKLKFLAKYRP